jgi:hypothetical protein
MPPLSIPPPPHPTTTNHPRSTASLLSSTLHATNADPPPPLHSPMLAQEQSRMASGGIMEQMVGITRVLAGSGDADGK